MFDDFRLDRARGDSDHAPLAGRRVLIVDPADASRQILRDLITGLGCAGFVNAASYADAMKALPPGARIDFVFSEYNLNGPRDGQQLLEELRARRLLPRATGFVIVTGEAGYRRVVAAAEFAPDDYLIKPFSAELLRARVLRLLQKKRALAPAHALIAAGRQDDAARCALQLSRNLPRYAADCLRLAIDVLQEIGRVEQAEALLQQAMQPKAAPWMRLRLAAVRVQQGRLAEAEAELTGIVGAHREMLRAYDALADVKHRLGKREEALAVLERAAALSEMNVARMRKLGALAETLGRHEQAEQAYSTVLARVRDSALLAAEDYANLSRALVTQGKLDEAEKIAVDQKRMMCGHRDAELTAALLQMQRACRAADTARAQQALEAIVELEAGERGAELSPRLLVAVVRACFDFGQAAIALAVAERLAQRAGVDAEVLAELRDLLDQQHGREQRAGAPLDRKGIARALAQMDATGYDEALALRLARSLAHWRGRADAEEDADDLDALAASFGALRLKYGIAS